MASAVKVLPEQTLIQADSFHAIPHRLGIFHCQLKKEVAKAELKVAGHATCLANAKTPKTALKREKELELAKIELIIAADRLEWFEEYYFKLIHQLRPFTSKGLPHTIADAEMKMKQSIIQLIFNVETRILLGLKDMENEPFVMRTFYNFQNLLLAYHRKTGTNLLPNIIIMYKFY